jgi:hypothetical protein
LNIMTLDQFRSAFQTGGFRTVNVVASGGLFFVTGAPRHGERVTLATTRGKQERGFRDPAKAIAVLYEIGVRKVEVDTSAWSPEQALVEGRRRPDTAERQRRAHEAAVHDAWFRAEVEQSLREADAPDADWVSNEDAKTLSGDRHARWRAQAARSE